MNFWYFVMNTKKKQTDYARTAVDKAVTFADTDGILV